MYPNDQSTRLYLKKLTSFPGSARSLLGNKSLHLSCRSLVATTIGVIIIYFFYKMLYKDLCKSCCYYLLEDHNKRRQYGMAVFCVH